MLMDEGDGEPGTSIGLAGPAIGPEISTVLKQEYKMKVMSILKKKQNS